MTPLTNETPNHSTNEFNDHAPDCPRCILIEGVMARFQIKAVTCMNSDLLDHIVELEHELATLKKYDNAEMTINGETHKVQRALYLGAGIYATYVADPT